MSRERNTGTARCGIVLHPAGHTLSPVLHSEAYRELGLDAEYAVYDTPAAAFDARLQALAAAGIRQLSVSLPHKERALAFADRASDAARAIGAANTLTWQADGRVVADNTDWIGFLRALEPLGDWRAKRATVLGAGGAARAIVYALGQLGCQIAIVARSPARAERLAAELGARVGSLHDPCDLLVNATPVGMHPQPDATPVPAAELRSSAAIFDTIYRPAETRLMREGRARGCRVEGGLGMLIQQAVEQVFLWSGKRPDAAVLERAARGALQQAPGEPQSSESGC